MARRYKPGESALTKEDQMFYGEKNEVATDDIVASCVAADAAAKEQKATTSSTNVEEPSIENSDAFDPLEAIGQSIDRQVRPVTLKWEVAVAWGDDIDREAAEDPDPDSTMECFAAQLSSEAWVEIREQERLQAKENEVQLEGADTDLTGSKDSDFEVVMMCNDETNEVRDDWKQYLEQGKGKRDFHAESETTSADEEGSSREIF